MKAMANAHWRSGCWGAVVAAVVGVSSMASAEVVESGCGTMASLKFFTRAPEPVLPLLSQVVESQGGYTIYGHVEVACAAACDAACRGLLELTKPQETVWLWTDSTAIRVPDTITVTYGTRETFPLDVYSVRRDTAVTIYASLSPPEASNGSETSTRILRVLNLDVVSLTLHAAQVEGGDTVGGHVSINYPPVERTRIDLSSTEPAVASLPVTGVHVEAGQTTVGFNVNTYPVDVTTRVGIVTARGYTRHEAVLDVLPPDPGGPVTLKTLLLNNGSDLEVTPPADGTQTIIGRVELTDVAPEDVYITLSDEGPIDTDFTALVFFPEGQTLLIPEGESRAAFPLIVNPCRFFATSCRCDSNINAEFEGQKVTAHLRVKGCESSTVQRPSVIRKAHTSPPVRFLRGDANGDARVDVADALISISYLFGGDPEPACLKSFDATDDGRVNLADPLALLGNVFSALPPPPPPFDSCGIDRTADGLPCVSHEACLSA